MNVQKAYQLDPGTIESLEDVKVILDKLNLTTYPEGDDWDLLQQYFTIETEVQKALVPDNELPTFDTLTTVLDTQDYGEGS
jgi:hypothetical protein